MNLRSFFPVILLAASVATVSYGQDLPDPPLTDYSQDFEGLTLAGDVPVNEEPGFDALSSDGWMVAGSNFFGTPDAFGEFNFFFGNFPAPNYAQNDGFSGVVANQGTGGQGLQHLNVFTDFGERVAHDGVDNVLDARVFQEQTIGAADLGETVSFEFEFKRNFENNTDDFGPNGNTQTFAFVRVLNSLDTTFATLAETNIETTSAELSTWTQGEAELFIDPTFEGQLLQFGFFSVSQNNYNSGIVYDNLVFSALSLIHI